MDTFVLYVNLSISILTIVLLNCFSSIFQSFNAEIKNCKFLFLKNRHLPNLTIRYLSIYHGLFWLFSDLLVGLKLSWKRRYRVRAA